MEPDMLTIIYQGITLYFVILLLVAVWKEEKKSLQITAALSLIPFILRLLMIK
jgi:hypothetical protein